MQPCPRAPYAASLAALGEEAPAPVTDAVERRAAWDAVLVGGERALLDELVTVWPAGRTRLNLGDATGYAAGGGTFQKYVGALRRLGLMEEAGSELRASEAIVPASPAVRAGR
jgi:hypothetical protein